MKLTPDQLEEGMLVAGNVLDINHRLLIPRGERIEKRHIRVLKIWGIQEVAIVGEEDEVPARSLTPEDALAEARKTMARVMENVDINHPALMEIYRLSVRYRAEQPELPFVDAPAAPVLKPERFADQIPPKLRNENLKLPETPLMVAELNKVIDNPYASASDIAAIVNQSASLSALLLRIVNSVFYNFAEKIDSISWAVTLIGTTEVVNLAYGISIMEAFKDIPRQVIDVQSFIRHSLFCGILSRILGARKNLVQTEQLFVSGLLHDIGRLVMYKYYPEHSHALLSLRDEQQKPLYRVEEEFGGIQHAAIGYYLMKKWNLPGELVDVIFHHHTPCRAKDPLKAGIVHLADIITVGMGMGTSGEVYIPVFDQAAWRKLELSPSLFEPAVRQALHQLKFLGIFSQG
jgi:HD-like signal output (HDOD) protein